MARVIFDIEAIGFLDVVRKRSDVWCIALAEEGTTDVELYADFTDDTDQEKYPIKGDLLEGVKRLNEFETIVAHHVLGYDFFALKRVFGKEFTHKPSTCWDTLIQSKLQWFDRRAVKGVKGVHGLAPWGARLGVSKPKVDDFTIGMCDEMAERVIEDVHINLKTLIALDREKVNLEALGLDMTEAFVTEHEYRYNSTMQEINGVEFDVEHAKKTVKKFTVLAEELALEIEPQMPEYVEQISTKSTWVDTLVNLGLLDKDFNDLKVEESQRKGYWVKNTTNQQRKVLSSMGIDKETLKDFITITEARERVGKWKDYPLKHAVKPTTKFVLKNGLYNKATCEYFTLEPEDARKGRLVTGAYSKVEFIKPKLTQHDKVKKFLLTQGWIPTEFNLHKVNKENLKDENNAYVLKDGRTYTLKNKEIFVAPMSPKLTEDSYESITGELGIQVSHYNTYMHRIRFLENPTDDEKGLINCVRSDGRIGAGVNNSNTATLRATHSVVVNTPSAGALGGEEIRQCFVAKANKTLVSCDMNSAQLSLAAYYANNFEYFKAVIDGDEYDADHNYLGNDGHTYNAKAFGLISDEQWEDARAMLPEKFQKSSLEQAITKGRKRSKGCTFATIFGAAGAKIGKMAGNEAGGNEMKRSFLAKIGLDEVLKAVAPEYAYVKGKRIVKKGDKSMASKWTRPKTKGWYIQVAGGYYTYCDSPHKAINYLIQGSEAYCQKLAINHMNRAMRKAKLDVKQVIDYHDEVTFESSFEDADAVGKCIEEGYTHASNVLFEWHNKHSTYFNSRGFAINLASPSQQGANWAEIH